MAFVALYSVRHTFFQKASDGGNQSGEFKWLRFCMLA